MLTRNDDYWGTKPAIRDLVWRKVVEVNSRLAGLEAGQCDVMDRVPVHEVTRINRNPRVSVRSVPGLRIYFFALNVNFKPWDNKLVRQAANYCVDADSIVKNIFDGNGEVLQGPVGPRVIGYNPNLKRYPYDPKKARELLKKAGHPNGVDIKLHFSPGKYDKDTELVQVVASQMSKGGFRVELVPQEWVVFWGRGGVNGGQDPLLLHRQGQRHRRRYPAVPVFPDGRLQAHQLQQSRIRPARGRRAGRVQRRQAVADPPEDERSHHGGSADDPVVPAFRTTTGRRGTSSGRRVRTRRSCWKR